MIDDDDRPLDARYRRRLRSTLQAMVADDVAEPTRARTKRRTLVIAAASASAIAASALIAGALATTWADGGERVEIVCLDHGGAAAVASVADAATVTLPTPGGTLSVRDAESACRALWSDGILQRESVEFQVGGQRSGDHDAEPGPPPGPDLVVCTLPDGRPGVLPGDESACASSGIDPWKE